jgi:hypothetical protein
MRAYEPVALLPVDNEDPRVFAKDRFRLSRVVGAVVRLTLDEGLGCIMISLPSALRRQFEERGPIDGPSVPTNTPYVLGIDLSCTAPKG